MPSSCVKKRYEAFRPAAAAVSADELAATAQSQANATVTGSL